MFSYMYGLRRRPSVSVEWPLANVWLGVTAEDQKRANERIPLLTEIPAAVRFVSCEPLLGPVDLTKSLPFLDWIIAGGESGPKARPSQPDWFRDLRDQCAEYRTPFLFKQWGEWGPVPSHDCEWASGGYSTLMDRIGKRRAGRVLDGRTHQEFPS